MERVLGRFAGELYVFLRIVAGLLFACHGAQKLLGALGGRKVELASQMGLVGRHRAGGRHTDRDRPVHQSHRVRGQRRDGVRVLPGPCPEVALANHERRRAGRALLLPVPLYGGARLGAVERRSARQRKEVASRITTR